MVDIACVVTTELEPLFIINRPTYVVNIVNMVGGDVSSGQIPVDTMIGVSIPAVSATGLLFILPARNVLNQMLFTETAGFDTTIDIGTFLGGSDIVHNVVIPANTQVPVTVVGLSHIVFKVDQMIYITSAAWGGASVNVRVWYAY